MSAEKPEVGDVWLSLTGRYFGNELLKDNKYHVYGEVDGKYILLDQITLKSINCSSFNNSYERNKYYKYLGKSKACISDLFEIKDEI